MGDGSVQSVADELRAEGRAAYYLGPEASGLALTDVTRVTENGPEFQVWASYGTCHPAMFDDGGCMDPLSVSTLEWRPDVTGVSCQRLEPQLGVPAGLVMGELTLFTERVQVGVVHVDDLADYDGHRGLALLKDLRVIGAAQPVGTLPPPDPEVATWVDGFCGTVPGASVEHPMEEPPGATSGGPGRAGSTPRVSAVHTASPGRDGSTLKRWTGTSIAPSSWATCAGRSAPTWSATPPRVTRTRSPTPS